jgi:hypothetical protein
MPIVLTKKVSWASIVRLGCILSDHCGPEPKWNGEMPVEDRHLKKWEFSQAFRLGRRCPMNCLSFGGREAALNGQFTRASCFAWLKAKQEIDILQARLDNEMYSLREKYEYRHAVEEIDQFLHGLSAYAESDVDHLTWQSATSDAKIVCVRTTHRSAARGTTYSWIAEFHEGNKPSWYAKLWSELSEDTSDELYPQPSKDEESAAPVQAAPDADW